MSHVQEYLQKKAIVFTDFDGTVTLQDSNDYITDHLGFGYDARKVLNDKILSGELSFSAAFSEMLESIHAPFEECTDLLLKVIQLDPGFKKTYEWCLEQDIPIIVVSSGMQPIIEVLLVKLLGQDALKNIEIVSNHTKINEDGSWEIIYRDETPFGHDKSRAIIPYREARAQSGNKSQILFYCGDGVSDLSAAKETDLLFAKRGKDLVTYCKRENVTFKQFDSFEDILKSIQDVISGKTTVEQLNENAK
ncbi:hypothetical protein WICPIJ_001254 [Wickerhamomyces pijperi]|uniref:Pdp3-interacting factor 1 n=1 Tax=Wickerhamomyces pijperi TaxID=599730 RepID=A0A9P8QBY2_WICPI|nr:hypothetical protein WICPIJ_001254 [Wickerhamomyces pijperi]